GPPGSAARAGPRLALTSTTPTPGSGIAAGGAGPPFDPVSGSLSAFFFGLHGERKRLCAATTSVPPCEAQTLASSEGCLVRSTLTRLTKLPAASVWTDTGDTTAWPLVRSARFRRTVSLARRPLPVATTLVTSVQV